jgi:hypothetical protein
MKLVKSVLLALFARPALELAGFLLIALFIGWFWAGLLLVASSLLGIRLLRKFGRRDLDRVRGALVSDGLQGIHLDDPAVGPHRGRVAACRSGFYHGCVRRCIVHSAAAQTHRRRSRIRA